MTAPDFQTQARVEIKLALMQAASNAMGDTFNRSDIESMAENMARYLMPDLLSLHQAELEQAQAAARIDETRYYAQLLKLNEQSIVQAALDGRKMITISLRKIFEYRLKQLHKGRRLAQLRTDAGGEEA